jgi:hypothetical protein
VSIDEVIHEEPVQGSSAQVPHHDLTPEEWKEFNAPDSTDAELEAAFEPLSQEQSEDTPREHHNRLRAVAAEAEKAAEDAPKRHRRRSVSAVSRSQLK